MIEPREYRKRRESLLKQLDGAVGLIFSGEHPLPRIGKWQADENFVYLTGMTRERGAAILFDPQNDNPHRRISLFLKPLDTEAERWDGYREQISESLRQKTGFKSIFRTNHLPAMVTSALRRSKRAACLLPFSVYPTEPSADLKIFQQVAQRVPGLRIEDQTHLLMRMRAIKSPAELRMIEQAARITVSAYQQVIRHIRPGVNESQIQLALETVYRQQGGDVAYGTIVGSGINGTVLHYVDNDRPLDEGDLVVIDSAASYGGYASDITRTFPVSGRFTSEQRELYEIVLNAQSQAIKASRPGARFWEIDSAARSVIEKAGLGDAFIHSIGHPLGLNVHDVVPDHPLKPGMVITIEPGIYLPERKLGIRIEDDLVITRNGHRNITQSVPKTVRDIESSMR